MFIGKQEVAQNAILLTYLFTVWKLHKLYFIMYILYCNRSTSRNNIRTTTIKICKY